MPENGSFHCKQKHHFIIKEHLHRLVYELLKVMKVDQNGNFIATFMLLSIIIISMNFSHQYQCFGQPCDPFMLTLSFILRTPSF